MSISDIIRYIMKMDIMTLALIGGVGLGLISLLIVLILLKRNSKTTPIESLEGFSSFERAKRVRADAYLLAIDVDANTIRWIPLRDMGNYYMFMTRKTGRFLPVDKRPLMVEGRPVFVGVKTSNSSVEVSIPVSVSSNLLKIRDKESFSKSPSFMSSIRKLYEKILEEPVVNETAESSLAVEIDYSGLFIQYATLIARAFERTMDAARSYLVSSFERGEDIEKKTTQAETWGKFMIYGSIAILLGIIALVIYNVMKGG